MTSFPFYMLLLLAGLAFAAPGKKYVSETYFIIEPSVVRRYQHYGYDKDTAIETIKGDLDYSLLQINKYYSSMTNKGLNIEIRAMHVDFLSSEMFSDNQIEDGKDLNGAESLVVIKKYLKDNKVHDTYPYDMAIVFTGFNMFLKNGSDKKKIVGYARVKATCDINRNFGIVVFEGTEYTPLITAHEIGHILGSSHDTNTSVECLAKDGYIMAPSSTDSDDHRWEFSNCTKDKILSYIEKLDNSNNNCLLSTTTPASTVTMRAQIGRDIINPEKICQRRYNNTKQYFCLTDSMYNGTYIGDAMCVKLYCGNEPKFCHSAMSSDGMVCDIGKRCDRGECKTAPLDFPAPERTNGCVYPDEKSNPLLTNFEGTCSDVVMKKGGINCYKKSFRERCCTTCTKRLSKIKGCEYGNRAYNCHLFSKENICSTAKDRKLCCKKCHGYKPRKE